MTDNCKVELCPVCRFLSLQVLVLMCPVCRFLQFPVELQLRGVCLDSEVDKFYVLHTSTELHGHGGSVLRDVVK